VCEPLGQAYIGQLDLTAADHGVTSHVQISGLTLQAFRTVCAASPCGADNSIGNATAAATPVTADR
jgi:hypothetical protein